MTTAKLSPSRVRVLSLLATLPKAIVSQHTNEDAATVHGPTAKLLAAAGLVTIEDDHERNKRFAIITDAGLKAIGSEPSEAARKRAVARMVAETAAKAKPVAEPKAKPEYAQTVPAGGFRYLRGEVIKDPRVAGATYAVAYGRRIRRGRAAGLLEVTLAPIDSKIGKSGNAYATVIRVRQGQRFQDWEAPIKPITVDKVNAALAKLSETKEGIDKAKEERAEKGRKVMGEVDFTSVRRYQEYGCENIKPGDVVTVKYRDCGPRKETVVKLNTATGKVAIKAPQYKSGYRWIHATSITAVSAPERALPVTLSRIHKAEIEANGWWQARIGSEFIERSYVIAKTPEDARNKGTTYDTPSNTVYRDPATGYFWRDTGCFD